MLEVKQEDLDSIRSIQEDYAIIAQSRGQLEFAKYEIEQQIQEIINEHAGLKERESALAIDIRQRYGEGSINIETGEFTPAVTE